MLKDLNKYNIPGVYSLINHKDKTVSIRYTSNSISKQLSNNIDNIANAQSKMGKDLAQGNLVLSLLEETSLKGIELKLRVSYWIAHYNALDYSFYTDQALPIIPRIGIDIVSDLTGEDLTVYRAMVYLSDSRGNKAILGVFKTMSEAESFKTLHYNDPSSVYTLVYADNEETKEYNRVNLKKRIPRK